MVTLRLASRAPGRPAPDVVIPPRPACTFVDGMTLNGGTPNVIHVYAAGALDPRLARAGRARCARAPASSMHELTIYILYIYGRSVCSLPKRFTSDSERAMVHRLCTEAVRVAAAHRAGRRVDRMYVDVRGWDYVARVLTGRRAREGLQSEDCGRARRRRRRPARSRPNLTSAPQAAPGSRSAAAGGRRPT